LLLHDIFRRVLRRKVCWMGLLMIGVAVTPATAQIDSRKESELKLYVVSDIEGAAGVVDHRQQCGWDETKFWYSPYLDQARRLTTLELNALIEGALEGGVTEIVIWDSHWLFPGSFDVELLHPECNVVVNAGNEGPVGLDGSFDAMMQVGLHGRKGAPGSVIGHGGWILNDKEIGEVGMNATIAGYYGIPCILVCGDRAATEEAQAMIPNVVTVATKESIPGPDGGLTTQVMSLTPAKSQQLIREATRRAVENIARVRPLEPEKPLRLQFELSSKDEADSYMKNHPDARRVSDLVVERSGDDLFRLFD